MDFSTILSQITADPSKTAAITAVTSLIMAACAVAISLISTIIAVLSLYSQKKHNRLSVLPHLTTWTHEDHKRGAYQVLLMNKGIGPAFITGSTIRIDDSQVEGMGLEAIANAVKILFPGYHYHLDSAYVDDGFAISTNEKILLISIQFLGEKRLPKKDIDSAVSRIDLRIKYQSSYKQKFKYSSQESLQKVLKNAQKEKQGHF